MKLKYHVIHESTQGQLETKVAEMIDRGWSPNGPAQVMVVEMETTREDRDGEPVFVCKSSDLAWTQTMVGMFREEGDIEVEGVTSFGGPDRGGPSDSPTYPPTPNPKNSLQI